MRGVRHGVKSERAKREGMTIVGTRIAEESGMIG